MSQHSAIIQVLIGVGGNHGQWSSSSLLSLLTVDELAAFDNAIFVLVYSGIGSSLHDSIELVLQPESLPCMPSSSEMTTTLTTLLSWVRNT